MPVDRDDGATDDDGAPSTTAPPSATAPRSETALRSATPRPQNANGAASGALRGPMDDPGNDVYGDRDPIDRFLSLIGPRLDEVRSLLDEATTRWRGDALRVGEGTRAAPERDLFHELGLITREDWDELELRVAQLEHRLRLIEARLDR